MRLNFVGIAQTLTPLIPLIPEEQIRLLSLLCDSIAASVIHARPGRREPRCKKRRPKNYQRLTKPRHEMQETPHRGKLRAEGA